MIEQTLAPLMHYIDTPNAAEVQVTEPGGVWVEIPGAPAQYHEDPALTLDYFKRLARALSNSSNIANFESRPFLDMTIPGGHRLCLCLGNAVKSGVGASIRISRPRAFSIEDYGLSDEHLDLFRTAINRKWNILISGGMFSGKTSLLNALLALLPTTDRIISVEDLPELDLTHIPNRTEFIVNRAATNEDIDILAVLQAIMRMRPDRVILGEQGPQNSHIFQRIINMGHGGTVSTIHADNPDLATEALIQNIEAAGHPSGVARKIFKANLHLIVQIARNPATKRREIVAIKTTETTP